MTALIKRQQQQQLAVQQQKTGGAQVAQVQVSAQTALTPAQILAQAGMQVCQDSVLSLFTIILYIYIYIYIINVKVSLMFVTLSRVNCSTNHHEILYTYF